MSWRDTVAHGNHRWLLNEAKDIVNAHLKDRFEDGELQSPYENGSWLDVIQIFDYTRDDWKDTTINQELFDLIIKIKIHVKYDFVARCALQYIAHYLIATRTLSWWCRPVYEGNLKYVLQRYFPLQSKPLNYDYLRYVVNSDLDTGRIETEVVVTS